jgi:branched-chain amino acid transport system permease protein
VARLLALAALALPLALQAADQAFYLSLATRVLIYALAASSLNLVLGYGGMVSFGHAAFIGAGAYVSGVLLAEGVSSAWINWPAAVLASAILAAAIGAASLRTRGVYFIMITLAFAQMMYYLVNSVKAYGGDEGLTLPARARLGFGIPADNEIAFYYVALALLAGFLYALHRLSQARFGRALVGIRENEGRMEAIGFPVLRYQLAAFVIAGAVAGLAGALLASHGKYVSPNLLHWTQSGTLMIMVILGGVGRLWGGAIGAVVLLGLEESLSSVTLHSPLFVGAALLAIVLFAPQGLAGLAAGRRHA